MAKYLDKAGVAYLLDRLHDIIEKVAIGDINLSDYVTKEELQKELNSLNIDIDLSAYVSNEELTTVLNEYATEDYVINAINNAQLGGGDGSSIDLSIYATTEAMNTALEKKAEKVHTHSIYATKEYVDNSLEGIDVDLTGYATEDYVSEYVNEAVSDIEVSGAEVYYGTEEPTDGQEIWINPDGETENYATIAYVDEAISNIDTSNVNLEGYAKTADVNSALANKADKVHTHKLADIADYTAPTVDLSGYYTKTEVNAALEEKANAVHTHSEYLTQHQDISGKADVDHTHTISEITDYVETDLSDYATKTYVQDEIDKIDASVTVEGIGQAGTGVCAEIFNYHSSLNPNNVASGSYSHAKGRNTTASATCAYAEGLNTIAASAYQHVQGKFNIEDANDKYAHIVGNGDAMTQKNAHTLDWNGNAWFAGKVYVGGTSIDDAVELGAGGESVDLSNYYNKEETNALIPTDEHINSLIDTKLGVIENGTY